MKDTYKINILALVAFERGSKIFRNAEIEAGRSKMSASIPVIQRHFHVYL